MTSKVFFANSATSPVPPSVRQLICPSSEETVANVICFLSRVIDCVWNCLYRGNPIRILKCFLKLLAESRGSNKAMAQLNCTPLHVNSLFRLVLYLLSRPIEKVDTQMSVLDTLAEISRNQHLFFSLNSDDIPTFYGSLMHLIFMLSDRPYSLTAKNDQINSGLERGCAQVPFNVFVQCI